MGAESERLSRAGRYVLGMMSEMERERAERDLEFDAKFRAAVVGVAERMHLFDLGEVADKPDWQVADWHKVAARIGEMPHMRSAPNVVPMNPATAQRPPARIAARLERRPERPRAADRLVVKLAIAIAVAFVVGYLTGIGSAPR